jgi:hypothetical protein
MKNFFMVVISFMFILGLVSCDKTSNLGEVWTNINQDILVEVTDEFAIPELEEEYSDVVVSWSSSNTDILANDGSVSTPIFDTVVVVTVVLDNGDTDEDHDVNVTVKGLSVAQRVAAAKEVINVVDLQPDLDLSSIESMYGVEIAFISADESVIDNSGIITQNGLEQIVDLAFTVLDSGSSSVSETFTLEANILPVTDLEQVDYVISMLEDYANVTESVTLISSITDYVPVITWVSNTPSVLSEAGILTQPVDSVDVTLTATVTLGDVSKTKAVVAHVTGYSDTQRVESAKSEYTFDVTAAIDNFTLDLSADYDVDINWTSSASNIVIVGDQAIVTRPTIAETEAHVVLTADFVYGNASVSKTFAVNIAKCTYSSYTFQAPTVSEYIVGDTPDNTGGAFTFILDDSTEYVINLDASMIDVITFIQTGEISINANFIDVSETYIVNVYNEVIDKVIAVNESVIEDFDDIYSPQLSFDNTQTPNSLVVDEANGALSGNAMYYESAGNYDCLFINGGVAYEASETYRITFDYKLTAFTDTIYFQLNGGSAGNLFTQFGSPTDLDTWKEFSYVVTLGDTTDYLIQIFPGGGVGTTSMLIDNIKVEHISNEPAKTVVGEIGIGDYVFESFGDLANAPFTQDIAPTPNSMVIGESEGSIDGMSLYVESPGSYTGIYLNETFNYTPLATYRITFDYKVTELTDTIYFQLNGGAAGNLFKEFGLLEEVGEVQTFTWDVTLADTNDYVIQIFPGGGSTVTKVILDNIKIERITGESSTTVTGELAEGEYVLDTFGDSENVPFTLDLAPTPNSAVVTESNLDFSALYFESAGSYTGIYINENFQYTPNATYRITFDYELSAFVDTLYFQLTGPAGNLVTQFGLLGDVGSVQTFTWDVALGDSSDYIIQIFPGGGTSVTSFYMDNLKVERLEVEESITTSTELAIGESVVMSFGDPANEPFTLDLAPTPDSGIVVDGVLSGSALNYVTPGSYTGIFLNENFIYTANAEYTISFTYHVVSFVDTIYFQLTGPAGNQFVQFGSLAEVGTTQTFTWDVTLGDSSDYIIQIFPGGGVEETNLVIDNLVAERIG